MAPPVKAEKGEAEPHRHEVVEAKKAPEALERDQDLAPTTTIVERKIERDQDQVSRRAAREALARKSSGGDDRGGTMYSKAPTALKREEDQDEGLPPSAAATGSKAKIKSVEERRAEAFARKNSGDGGGTIYSRTSSLDSGFAGDASEKSESVFLKGLDDKIARKVARMKKNAGAAAGEGGRKAKAVEGIDDDKFDQNSSGGGIKTPDEQKKNSGEALAAGNTTSGAVPSSFDVTTTEGRWRLKLGGRGGGKKARKTTASGTGESMDEYAATEERWHRKLSLGLSDKSGGSREEREATASRESSLAIHEHSVAPGAYAFPGIGDGNGGPENEAAYEQAATATMDQDGRFEDDEPPVADMEAGIEETEHFSATLAPSEREVAMQENLTREFGATHAPADNSPSSGQDQVIQNMMDSAPVVEGVSIVAKECPTTTPSGHSFSAKARAYLKRHAVAFTALAFAVSALAFAIPALAVVLQNKDRPSSSPPAVTQAQDETQSTGPSPPPTSPPTTPLTRSDLLRTVILSLLPDGGKGMNTSRALEDSSSAQGRALRWLADEDGLQVDPGKALAVAQRFGLAVLYYATGGDQTWINGANFLSSGHECGWIKGEQDAYAAERTDGFADVFNEVGVRCSSDNVTVDTLDMGNNRITGSLPEELLLLRDLKKITFWANGLVGTIPSFLSRLRKLQYLSLSENKITGTIPSFFTELPELERLMLGNNDLIGGTIPSFVAKLSNLWQLSLHGCELTGTIPSFLGKLTRLERLSLRSNKLHGTLPSSLKELTNLERVFLWQNELTGTIPELFANMPNLTHLSLYINLFQGPLPSSLTELTKLKSLRLHQNELTGPIPAALDNMAQLQYLYLHENQLTGPLPATLGNMTQLKYLHLYENKLTGMIPAALGNLTQLQTIRVQGNHLTGTLPSSLRELTLLESLSVSRNNVTGTIPTFLGNLTELFNLGVSSTYLTGTIPSSLGNLAKLEDLWLSGIGLTGTIPTSLGKLAELRGLNLHDNELTGTIPPTLGNLTKVEWLHLHRNMLQGTMPQTLSQLEFLNHLWIQKNNFTGDISFLCSKLNIDIGADCFGNGTEVVCPCCMVCCSDELGLVGKFNETIYQDYEHVKPGC